MKENTETDILSEPYAKWLELTLSHMIEDKPKKIAISAVLDDGGIATSFYMCSPADLMLLAGALQLEAMHGVVEDELDEDDEEGDEE